MHPSPAKALLRSLPRCKTGPPVARVARSTRLPFSIPRNPHHIPGKIRRLRNRQARGSRSAFTSAGVASITPTGTPLGSAGLGAATQGPDLTCNKHEARQPSDRGSTAVSAPQYAAVRAPPAARLLAAAALRVAGPRGTQGGGRGHGPPRRRGSGRAGSTAPPRGPAGPAQSIGTASPSKSCRAQRHAQHRQGGDLRGVGLVVRVGAQAAQALLLPVSHRRTANPMGWARLAAARGPRGIRCYRHRTTS